jgi:SAM-dependent methyltransferase
MSDCPSCRTPGMEPFYSQPRVPSHSVLLLDSADEARAFPTGRIELGVCHACGFVSNMAVDETLQAYSSQCEETQAFSPRFREFARGLAQRIVDRHDVRGRTVLEIGCGKGEFLSMLCEAGANRGIGIDPAVIPDRVPKPARGELEVIADYYDARHAEVDADVVLCRHTLEHIPRTLDFLELVMASRPGRAGALLVFELPDVGRVLRERAFWDVYYEHCSYFTPGSLARLFRRAACEPLELELDFDDQYILISGRREAGTGRPLPLEDTPAQVAEEAREFARGVERTIDGWRERIAAVRARGGRVALWGSGSKAVSFLSHLEAGLVDAVVDVNPHRHGRFLPGSGVEVESPERLRELGPELVIAMNPIYRSEIGADLAAMGLGARLDTV